MDDVELDSVDTFFTSQVNNVNPKKYARSNALTHNYCAADVATNVRMGARQKGQLGSLGLL